MTTDPRGMKAGVMLTAWLAVALTARAQNPLADPITDGPVPPRTTRTYKVPRDQFPPAAGDWQQRVGEFLTSKAGVDLANPEAPAFFYNDRTSILTVTSLRDQLDGIEAALQTSPAQQVAVEVKISEFAMTPENAELFQKFFSRDAGSKSRLQIPVAELAGETNQATTAALRTAILTDPEMRITIRALEQRVGVDLLSAPRGVTVSGRPVRVALEEPEEPVFDPPLHAPQKRREP